MPGQYQQLAHCPGNCSHVSVVRHIATSKEVHYASGEAKWNKRLSTSQLKVGTIGATQGMMFHSWWVSPLKKVVK